jgi:putative transposase
MQKSRFTEAQIMGAQRQMEGRMPVLGLSHQHAFYKLQAKYGGTDASIAGPMTRAILAAICRFRAPSRCA